MIEVFLYNYLNSVLDVKAYMEKPLNDKEYVLIEKTGSGRIDHINRAVIAIQSYAETLYKAAELNEKVKVAMENITDLDEISNCSLNSDYNYTDTTTKQYRYQAVFNLTY